MATRIPNPGPIFRPEPPSPNPNLSDSRHRQRQFFLRSYQFSRKQTLGDRIKSSFVRFKHCLWVRIRSAKRVRKFVWSGLRFAVNNKRRKIAKMLSYQFGGGLKSYEKFYKYELFYASPYHPPSCLW